MAAHERYPRSRRCRKGTEAELDREDLFYAVKAHASVVPGVREDNVGDLSRSVIGNDSGRHSYIERNSATGPHEES